MRERIDHSLIVLLVMAVEKWPVGSGKGIKGSGFAAGAARLHPAIRYIVYKLAKSENLQNEIPPAARGSRKLLNDFNALINAFIF